MHSPSPNGLNFRTMVLIGGFFVVDGFIFRVGFWTGLQRANQFSINGRLLDAIGANAKILRDVRKTNAAEGEDALRLGADFTAAFWFPRSAHVSHSPAESTSISSGVAKSCAPRLAGPFFLFV